jgi:hypothetical protein
VTSSSFVDWQTGVIVQAGGIIAEHGIKFILKVASAEDLNRDVIKASALLGFLVK